MVFPVDLQYGSNGRTPIGLNHWTSRKPPVQARTTLSENNWKPRKTWWSKWYVYQRSTIIRFSKSTGFCLLLPISAVLCFCLLLGLTDLLTFGKPEYQIVRYKIDIWGILYRAASIGWNWLTDKYVLFLNYPRFISSDAPANILKTSIVSLFFVFGETISLYFTNYIYCNSFCFKF